MRAHAGGSKKAFGRIVDGVLEAGMFEAEHIFIIDVICAAG